MTDRLRSKTFLQKLTEPQFLFPGLTCVLLIAIWANTLRNIDSRLQARTALAQESARDMAETYQAQLMRALREIELTLALVDFQSHNQPPDEALSTLAASDLLPPALFFRVNIYNSQSQQLAGFPANDLSLPPELSDVSQTAGADHEIDISDTFSDPDGRTWVSFAITHPHESGEQARIMTVTVDAEYFVSSYEPSRLGDQGLMAVVDRKGHIIARRSGDNISFGGSVLTDNVPEALLSGRGELVEYSHSTDPVNRYYTTQSLYGYPMTLVTGVAVDEQLSEFYAYQRQSLQQSALSTLALILIMGVLGHTSWQLHRSRMRLMAEQIAHSQHVEHLAFHDSLTGLPNRSLFSRLLNQSIREAKRDRQQLTVLFLDLDKFKLINDTLGHEAGDELLQEVARRVSSTLRSSDVVARLGGDEFIILLRNTSETAAITDISEKLMQAVCEPYALEGQETVITMSIGASVYPDDGLDEQTLTKHADMAMYHAKQEGRNQIRLFADLPADIKNAEVR
jgi:diguanylate cyclase (GGDEF)-like protein